MSDKRYPANIISSTAVEPTGSFEDDTASGTWSLQEAFTYVKAGLWPTPGNQRPLIEDVFSTYLYTGNGSSQRIENGINLGQSFGSGSVLVTESDSDWLVTQSSSTFALGTGNFTLECWVYRTSDTNETNNLIDLRQSDNTENKPSLAIDSGDKVAYYSNGSWRAVGTTSVPVGQWFHAAVVRSSGTTTVYYNGSAEATFSDSYNYSDATVVNIGGAWSGQFDLDGYIAEVRVSNNARYTGNFTPPTAPFSSDANTLLLTCQGADPFVDNSPNAFTITQNGSPQAATFGPFDAATPGEGGLVWIKDRGDGASFHALYDTERAISQRLSSNTTSAQSFVPGVTSFNADGFSLGTTYNASGNNFASWTFRKAPRFFDVVTYTGDGTTDGSKKIAHNLGIAPGCMIVKRTDSTGDWNVYHRQTASSPETRAVYLNLTATYATGGVWGNTLPTDTEFTVGSSSSTNVSGATYVAYLFAHDPLGPSGDGSNGLIACGSYTGNGSTDGPEINLGWEPQWVLLKRTDTTANWFILDTMRGLVVNGADQTLQPNNSDAENANSFTGFNLTPTGFKLVLNDTTLNASGGNYIYVAIRRGPMRQPTSGTEVFATQATRNATDGTPSQNAFTSNFPVDLMLMGGRGGYTDNALTLDRMRGGQRYLATNKTNVEATGWIGGLDDMDGVYLTVTTSQTSLYNAWMFRRAPGFFDVVAYTGTGSATTVSHNLGVAPELMIVKGRTNVQNWPVYAAPLGNSTVAFLNLNNAVFTGQSHWNSTTPTSSVFSLGDTFAANESGQSFIAYLFATVPGVSKVGSYTGNGSSQTIDCGFTSGARFVLIKRTDSTGDWYVWDSARGIVAGNDPHLSLNTTAAEVTTDDSVDADSSGFIVNQDAATNVNVSSASYIFLAIA